MFRNNLFLLELMLLTLILIWAANQTIGKLAMREMSPSVYTTLRFSLATPLMLLVLKWREGKWAFDRSVVLRLVGIGLVGVALYQTVFIAALKYTSVTNLA